MSRALYRLGRWSSRHRRRVVAGWVGLLVALLVSMGSVGGEVVESFSLPGTESQDAADLLEERFPELSGSAATMVVSGDDLAGSQRSAVEALAAEAATLPGVTSVEDPFGPGAQSQSGDATQFDVRYATEANEVHEADFDALTEAAEAASVDGLRVEIGGEVATAKARTEPGGTTEVIGVGVAVVVLLLAFGSILAMGLPLLTALVGVGTSLSVLLLLAAVTDVPSVAETLALMLGLAVGIDYALFIVSRHRSQVATGMEIDESIGRALATAGGAVVFAGCTVVIAMAGLSVVGIPFITFMGVATAASVVVAVLIAVTFLPALLGFAGGNINRLNVLGIGVEKETRTTEPLGARWTRWVTRRPWLSLALGLLLIGVLAAPMLDLRTAMSDAGVANTDTSRRQAYDTVADEYGEGANAVLSVVVDHTGLSGGEASAAVEDVQAALAGTEGVVTATGARANQAGDTSVLQIVPEGSATDESTSSLVHHLRDDVLPPIEEATGVETFVAGATAVNIDITDQLSSRLWLLMAVVIGLTFLVLLVAFRSVLVPIKAAIGILLSIGSSLGVVVAVFQWGWFNELLGIDTTQPIISFLPTIMFAILFGLSMDYEVFILSRVREDYLRTGDPHESVVSGVASSARVITAAAAIMVSVFGGFMLGDDPTIKMVGLGLAAAVLLDATVVRLILVPATMVMFDEANWWLPGWLDRLVPHVDIEGEKLLEELEQEEAKLVAAGSGPS